MKCLLALAVVIGSSLALAGPGQAQSCEAVQKRADALQARAAASLSRSARFEGSQHTFIGNDLVFTRPYCAVLRRAVQDDQRYIEFMEANLGCLDQFRKDRLPRRKASYERELDQVTRKCPYR